MTGSARSPLWILVMSGLLPGLAACGGSDGSGGGGNTPMDPIVPTAAQLAFLGQVSDVEVSATIGPEIRVAIQDSAGNTVSSADDPVTISIQANPGDGSLLGTTTVDAVDGIATFSDLAIDAPGVGYTLSASSGNLTEATGSPFDVLLLFYSVAAGASHTCAIGSGGSAYCWGSNDSGQLGNGTTDTATAPTPVVGGLEFGSIAVGNDHTCGTTTSGVAYCWGNNDQGQLGDGSTNGSITPVAVGGGLSFAALTAGHTHTCGIASDGSSYCWGRNFTGELGDGSTTERLTPTEVSTNETFTVISAGGSLLSSHTLAANDADEGYSWGADNAGQLGRSASGSCGGVTCSSAPGRIGGTESFTAVAAGRFHSCGINPTGAAYCWGENGNGQVGDGTRNDQQFPTAVTGGHEFTAITAGQSHTCGLDSDGAAWCWGLAVGGRLGDGSMFGESLSPAAVTGGLTFTELSAGALHTCGITPDGDAYCWGTNSADQLGDATTDDRAVPTPVADPAG